MIRKVQPGQSPAKPVPKGLQARCLISIKIFRPRERDCPLPRNDSVITNASRWEAQRAHNGYREGKFALASREHLRYLAILMRSTFLSLSLSLSAFASSFPALFHGPSLALVATNSKLLPLFAKLEYRKCVDTVHKFYLICFISFRPFCLRFEGRSRCRALSANDSARLIRCGIFGGNSSEI